MALSQSFDKFGMTFADAYHRITSLNYQVNEYTQTQYGEPTVDENGDPVPSEPTEVLVTEKNASFQVSVYVDADARSAQAQPVYTSFHTFTPDWESTDNVLAQAYAYLKTLDSYTEAVDA